VSEVEWHVGPVYHLSVNCAGGDVVLNQIALWANTTTFAVAAVTLVLAAGASARHPATWVRPYLVYHASYALWLLILTYAFFRAVYVLEPSQAVDSVIAGLRLVTSGAILWAYPTLAFALFADEGARRRTCVASLAVGVGILVPTAALVATGASSFLLGILNVLFNAYLLGLSVFAVLRARDASPSRQIRILMPLFWISVVFYLYAVIAGGLLTATGQAARILSAISASVYCLPWSLLVGIRLFRELAEPLSRGMDEEFASRFGITAREADVIERVVQGLPNKHIARELSISLRTVETHLNNVFRKCGVRSRTELIRKIQTGS